MDNARPSAGVFPLMALLAVALWLSMSTANAAIIGMELASAGSYGQASDDSFAASISASGQYVVFESGAATLTSPTAPAGVRQIYRKERGKPGLTRVSVNVRGTAPTMPSHTPAVDADGDRVVFASDASDLVTATPGPGTYVRDISFGMTRRVDVRPDGSALSTAVVSQSMWYPDITSDGKYVVFMSRDTMLVPGGGNGLVQIYRRDLETNTTVKVSCDVAGVEGNAHSGSPSISDDGRYVVFASGSTSLVASDTNNSQDVFLKDLKDGTITRVSVDSSGAQALGGGGSSHPVISGDGTHVAFLSDATNLVPGDNNAARDVFLRDLGANTTFRVSVSNFGRQGSAASYNPGISRDGRIVSFQSDADNLVNDGDHYYYGALFVYDSLAVNKLTRVPASFDFGGSVSVAGGYTSLSANGRYVAFDAKPASDKSSALVSGGTNGLRHVFLYDMGAPRVGAALATPKLSVSSPRHNAYFYASGSVTRHSGAKAKVQLKFYRWSKTLGRYVYYRTCTTYTAANGTAYKTRLRLPYTGKWRVRAYHPEDSRHLLSWSVYYRYFTVRT